MSRSVEDVLFTQKQEELFRWLSAPDPSENCNKALDRRQEGTGLWFFQTSLFQKWQIEENSFLWLHGIHGCGKTILSSSIIDYLEKACPERLLLYFYFDFNDSSKQTLEGLVRSLASQLYRKCKCAQAALDSLFSSHENGRRQPSSKSLFEVFSQMLNQAKDVWIVLDALNECRTPKGSLAEGLLSWIASLQSDQRNVHLLVTSRPEHEIEEVLRKLAKSEENIIPIQSDLINNDIRSYVRTRVRGGKLLERWGKTLYVLEEIETRLMEKANGM